MSSIDKTAVPERQAWAERRLRDGSVLKYRLTVLQQPERARACGQGAKSHADRRPVDPPPVVELRLFKGDDEKDVTFSYNSNFFLFATLENARSIAPGRVQASPSTSPVLTGVPVSGMAYLDRPAPAGYFIFPDLSVRHEGKYRLHFALYEECKEEDDRIGMTNPEVTHFRVEVKSKPFVVFSAKKFPGLAESTALSRVVAEQGCRVRIRRDVRMRRRSEKPGREGEDDEHAHRGTTPEPRGYASAIPQGQVQPAPEMMAKQERNPAPVQDYGRMNGYQERASYGAPIPNPPTSNNNMSYNTYQQPTSAQLISAPVHPPAAYQQAFANQEAASRGQAVEQRRDDMYEKRRQSDVNYFQTPQYGQQAQATPDRSYQNQYTPAPTQYAPPSSFIQPAHPAATAPPPRLSRDDLPPLKLAALEPRLPAALNSPSSATPSNSFMSQRPSTTPQTALPSPSTYGPSPSQTSSMYPHYQAPPPPPPPSTATQPDMWAFNQNKIAVAPEPAPRHAGSKRGWDQTFNDSHVRDRLQNGMRPNQTSAHYGIDVEDDDDEIDFAKMRMSYRRADGVEIVRALPDESELS